MRQTLHTKITLDALTMAIQRQRPAPGLIHHSDRGFQYTAEAYRQILARSGVSPSMSRKAITATMRRWRASSKPSKPRKSITGSTPPGQKPGAICSATTRASTNPVARTQRCATSAQRKRNAERLNPVSSSREDQPPSRYVQPRARAQLDRPPSDSRSSTTPKQTITLVLINPCYLSCGRSIVRREASEGSAQQQPPVQDDAVVESLPISSGPPLSEMSSRREALTRDSRRPLVIRGP